MAQRSFAKFVYDNQEWKSHLKQKEHEEFAYFVFSLRMIFYGLGSVFLTLFFLTKLSINMRWYHYILILLLVLAIVFIDKIILHMRKKFF